MLLLLLIWTLALLLFAATIVSIVAKTRSKSEADRPKPSNLKAEKQQPGMYVNFFADDMAACWLVCLVHGVGVHNAR